MTKYDIVGATGCATGIAHTFMAEEALKKAAKKLGYSIKIETHGQTGVENALTSKEIKEAKAVVIASDVDVDSDRFAGKKVVIVPVTKGIKVPEKLIEEALSKKTIYKPNLKPTSSNENKEVDSAKNKIGTTIYTSLMNGVSHMLPVVVAGGVLIAVSFFWGIYSSDPKSHEYNQFAAMLNTIGGTAMGLMVPLLAAYIAEALAKRSGLIVGFVAGMITFNGGGGFLGGIIAGYLAGVVILVLQKTLKFLPDKEFRGLKAIFLYPVLGVFIAGAIMYLLNTPIKGINLGMMSWLKSVENSNPLVLGIVVGCMCAFDFGGPVNKAAYLTGTALLAQGNYFFMAGVSAACIVPPLATGFAVLLNKQAYTKSERSAGYVNFLLGSTHITEGAIPFAAMNPFFNIPVFMIGSSIAAVLSYVSKIQVPAPHGGFIILPLVNKPFLWVFYILLGSIVSGILLAIIAGKSAKVHVGIDDRNNKLNEKEFKVSTIDDHNPNQILNVKNIKMNVDVSTKDEAVQYLANLAVKNDIAKNAQKVLDSYKNREEEGSTGMTDGIAIPHAQSATINKSSMMILKLCKGIEWNSLDGKKVNIVISFLIPQVDSNNHLKYLSNTAKLLTHADFIQKLQETSTPEEVKKLFSEYNL